MLKNKENAFWIISKSIDLAIKFKETQRDNFDLKQRLSIRLQPI